MIKTILLILQMVVSVALITCVLLQQKGAGVGSTFGGEAVVYRSRRGVEKILYYATIASATGLVLLSLYSIVLS
ncbi:MAG TPA: preprotein translocase subunit SecG [Candidatus Saccharimonadales bacterium]|nr:preprotein translocase subunit SecG [Candidatus Saccharimonadales bacterium]